MSSGNGVLTRNTIDNIVDSSIEEKWKLDKFGKFSASQIHKLVLSGPVVDRRSGMRRLFSDGGLTYIKQIARQSASIFSERDFRESFDMKAGLINEPESFGRLYGLLGIPDEYITYFGASNPKFFPYIPGSGCSPDVVVYGPDGEPAYGCELKNPKPDTHWDYLLNIGDAEALRRNCPDYFAQVQFSMMVLGVDKWLFCSYDGLLKNFSDKMLIIEVPRDKKFCDDLLIRLKQALYLKEEYMLTVKNRLKTA